MAINRRAPPYIQDLITLISSAPRRASNRSASNYDLVKKLASLKLGQPAFSVAAPCAWNSLPKKLKIVTDTPVFKRKLKTFLFKTAYLQYFLKV